MKITFLNAFLSFVKNVIELIENKVVCCQELFYLKMCQLIFSIHHSLISYNLRDVSSSYLVRTNE